MEQTTGKHLNKNSRGRGKPTGKHLNKNSRGRGKPTPLLTPEDIDQIEQVQTDSYGPLSRTRPSLSLRSIMLEFLLWPKERECKYWDYVRENW